MFGQKSDGASHLARLSVYRLADLLRSVTVCALVVVLYAKFGLFVKQKLRFIRGTRSLSWPL